MQILPFVVIALFIAVPVAYFVSYRLCYRAAIRKCLEIYNRGHAATIVCGDFWFKLHEDLDEKRDYPTFKFKDEQAIECRGKVIGTVKSIDWKSMIPHYI